MPTTNVTKRPATVVELKLYRALKVILCDPKLRTSVTTADPRAALQAVGAVEYAEQEVRFDVHSD